MCRTIDDGPWTMDTVSLKSGLKIKRPRVACGADPSTVSLLYQCDIAAHPGDLPDIREVAAWIADHCAAIPFLTGLSSSQCNDAAPYFAIEVRLECAD